MFLITSTVPFSAYIMVGIAIDRYFCICHPFSQAVNIPRAKVIICCMAFPALGFGITTALSYGTYRELLLPLNGTLASYNLTEDDIFTDARLQEYFKDQAYNHNFYPDIELDYYRTVLAEEWMATDDSGHASGDRTSVPTYPVYDDNHANSSSNFDNNYNDNDNFNNHHSNRSTTAKNLVTIFHFIGRYGQCASNNFFMSKEFLQIYQVVHSLNFLVAYVCVAILYVLIYKAIYTRRVRKARKRKNHLPLFDCAKDAAYKKDTLHVDLQSDNSAVVKNSVKKEKREQILSRKIAQSSKNDIRGPSATTKVPTDAGDDETEGLLSKV